MEYKPVIINNFLSDTDCDYLINTFKDKLHHSRTVNSITGQSEIHPSRTSSTHYLPANDQVVKIIQEKVANYLNISVKQIEGLQLLRYMKGEKYSYHHDYLRGDNISNQRVHTVLIYLNTLEPSDGGATSFYHHSIKVYPTKGTAVWFRNMTEKGELNDKSLHSGEEILTDAVKYAINVWTREYPL